MRVPSVFHVHDFLDMSLREIYEAVKTWLLVNIQNLDQLSNDEASAIKLVLSALLIILALYLTAIICIQSLRLLSWAISKADQAAHWLAGSHLVQPHPRDAAVKVNFSRKTVDQYRLGPKDAYQRRERWRKDLVSEHEYNRAQRKSEERAVAMSFREAVSGWNQYCSATGYKPSKPLESYSEVLDGYWWLHDGFLLLATVDVWSGEVKRHQAKLLDAPALQQSSWRDGLFKRRKRQLTAKEVQEIRLKAKLRL